MKPEQVEFQVDTYHKPSLRGTSNLRFNLSHSGEIALCAVTRGKQIGVDVEMMHPVNEMKAAFLSLWTRKEAFLKALGQGLRYPLNRFRVPLEASAIDQRLSILDDQTGVVLDWSLFSFSPASGSIGAVVIEGEVDECPTLHRFAL